MIIAVYDGKSGFDDPRGKLGIHKRKSRVQMVASSRSLAERSEKIFFNLELGTWNKKYRFFPDILLDSCGLAVRSK